MANSCALSIPAKSISCLGLQLGPSTQSQGSEGWPKGSPRLRPIKQEELQTCHKRQRERSLSVKNEGGRYDHSTSRGNTGKQK